LELNNHPLYETQLKIEGDMIDLGVSRYRAAQNFNQNREQPTFGGGAGALANNCIEDLANNITAWVTEIREKGRGRRARAYDLIKDVDPTMLAYFTVRLTLDQVLSRGGATLSMTATRLGLWIETELRLAEFEKDNAGLIFEFLRDMEKQTQNVLVRRRMLVGMMNRIGDQWEPWETERQFQVGALLIELLTKTWPVVEIYTGYGKKGTTEYRIRATETALNWIGQEDERRALLKPVTLPCVIPPMPWVSPTEGGYWTEEVRKSNPLLRAWNAKGRMKLLKKANPQQVYRAVNGLQATPWAINQPVLDVMREVWEGNLDLGVFPSREPSPLPARPANIDTDPEVLKVWKKAAAETYTANAKAVSSKLSLARTLDTARDYARYDQFYFVYQCDFRGRIYAISQGPNPQGSDVQKAVLRFAKGKQIGDGAGPRWLAIHGANTFGVDKVSMDDRVQWVNDHIDDILDCAEDPLQYLFWTDADSPWSFLAFCFEFAGYCKEGSAFVTHLPIMVDGTCNGLQHYSAILRDPVGGAATNLLPSETPQDIYRRVAERCMEKMQEDTESEAAKKWLAVGITRKITKRPVMVLPYGGTFNSCKDYVREAIKKDGIPATPDEIQYLSTMVWESIGDVVVAARIGMSFIRKMASAASKKKQHVTWVTPVGWPVLQQYYNMESRQMKTTLYGEIIKPRLESQGDTVDGRRSGQGLAPNFIHSMDAAALVKTVNECIDNGVTTFAVIHDSYGTLAPDMDELGDTLRNAFVTMYEQHDPLEELRSSIRELVGEKVQLDLVPAKGTLDLNEVRKSTFFFA
jgi:DNA-directed RNA polymerase